MKHLTALLLTALLVCLPLTGCGATDNTSATGQEEEVSGSELPVEDEEYTGEDGVKIGLGVITTTAKSTDADLEEEDDGLVNAESTVIGVLLDPDGVILDCKIDVLEIKVTISPDGSITTPADTAFLTKRELGDSYNMASVSSIGREWYEQADAFAEYCKGKTLEEIQGLSVNSDGKLDDGEELNASVTISVAEFVEALEKAVRYASVRGSAEGDSLGMAITGSFAEHSQDADAEDEEDGFVEVYNTYTLVTVGEDGSISGCFVDQTQARVTFSPQGYLTSGYDQPHPTKQERGDEYNMRNSSSIGREWYEQADAFAAYVTGKTMEEVHGISVDENGYVTDQELTASVTISISSFVDTLDMAVRDAHNSPESI